MSKKCVNFFVDPFQGFFHDIKLVEVGWTWVRWTGTSKNRASGRPVASVMENTVKKTSKIEGGKMKKQNIYVLLITQTVWGFH